MKPKTPAQRKLAQRERLRAAGFRLVQVPIHSADAARFQRFVDALKKRRGLTR